MSAHADLRRRTVKSLFWQLLGVGGQRVLQMVSLAALWRLIPKEDLGLFFGLLTGIGIIEALTMFVGEQSTISSQRTVDRRYLDTVFTVRVLRGLLISSALCGLAWPLAWFFDDAESAANYWLPGLFLVLAPNGVFDALQSPARAAHMKGLDFRRIVLGDFAAAVLGAGVTIALAATWQDVWALVIGYLCTTALKSAISYLSAPHRPRFCFDRAVLQELLHYNLGAAGAPFLLLLIFTSPALVLTKVLGDWGALAVYDGAGKLAKLPEDVFLRVLGPVAIPAYAQLRQDPERLQKAWLRAVHTFLLLGAPMTVSLAWCGDALPQLAFGADYAAIDGLFALLSLHGGLTGMTSVIGPLFWAIGRPQLDRNTQFVRCVVIYGLGIVLAKQHGVLGFAIAACVSIGVALLISAVLAMRILHVRPGAFAAAMRDGALIGAALFGAFVVVDHFAAPERWLRIGTAALLGGPVIGVLGLQLLRQRGGATPGGPDDEAAQVCDEANGPSLL
ncbi:MAG: oligosaccharide flippase family protein [Planctomycetes bacterium]|nr:oligosaccharide flippase family protein [Planctomycetota bacterium]